MNSETFAKKRQAGYQNYTRKTTQQHPRETLPKCVTFVKLNSHKLDNHLSTPQKAELEFLPEAQQTNIENSILSEMDKEYSSQRRSSNCQYNSNSCSRIAITDSISNFIDSQSSEHSDLSFRSEVVQVQRKDISTTAEKLSRTTFKYTSSLTTHEIKIFEKQLRFKPAFVALVQECIQQAYHSNLANKQYGKFEKLFAGFKDLKMSHPFKENQPNFDFKALQTPQSLMDKWLLDYSKHERLILSFDFIFSHVSFVVLMIFYWMQLDNQQPINPLICMSEQLQIRRNGDIMRQNILSILCNYVSFRSRQIINNPIVQRILNEFFRYIQTNFLKQNSNKNIESLCDSYLQLFKIRLQREIDIKEKLNIGNNFNDAHLDQIYLNYQKKDKFIKEVLQDQITLFLEIDRRNFVDTPLNRYYQTGQELDTNKFLANKHTALTCWILNLVLKKCKTNGWIAIEYCNRFYDLCRALYKQKNLERTVFFINILGNIKLNIPNLWRRFTEKVYEKKLEKVNEMIEKIAGEIQKIPFVSPKNEKSQENREIVIFEELRFFRIVQSIKDRFRDKQLISLNFHMDIQEFAKKVSAYKKIAQNQLFKQQNGEFKDHLYNKTIKMDLNYRFLNHYIYEILRKDKITEAQQFEKWKAEANFVNKNIHYPFQFWDLF